MEIETINQIREKRDSIREKINSLNVNDFNSATYGQENEYTFKELIRGIEALFIGAIFCANQYTKQKNIIEDYAYKTVLAKAIVRFSEQLKSKETTDKEYVHYITTALNEIHKDLLRKREK